MTLATSISLLLLVPIIPRLAAAEGKSAVQQVYTEAAKRHQEDPRNVKAAWELARACFDLADLATNKAERAAIAEQGIASARQAVALASNSAPTHYYLSLNLGQLARTRTFGALRLVRQMEQEFLTARNLEERFDYAGADRAVGLLYRDAPSFGSIGDRTKARQHLERAVELEPGYPDNRLCLLESYLEWGDESAARKQLAALEQIWPEARQKFSGPAWARGWADWDARLEQAKKKLDGAPRLETPRH
jgi:tetratricopeptide (TPR) repeat protein